jgi:gamma-glutamyltranspeptidase / glutathione hydrolase
MFTTRPELTGDFGMVASTHWLASAAGMSVLERGGNAFDAAVTAGFVLQVVEPHLNGPGGEVPILVWSEAEQRVSVVCGQGVAPAAATIEHFTDLGLDLVPGTGPLAATVPGAVGGWLLMLERWGTWSVADVLEPAIGYAEHGFPALDRISASIGAVERMFTTDWPTSAATWLPHGQVPRAGSRLTNPVLAATYRRLVAEAQAAATTREGQVAAARKAWYEGFVAEAIDAFSAREWMDDSGRPHAGLLTGDDLASWRATVEEPVGYDYRGVTVFKTGPWGQGPVFLQQLALLQGYDLSAATPGEYVHTVLESAKLAFADREAWYGDPRRVDVPLSGLLSPEYNEARRRLIGPQASYELRPGSPGGGRPPVLPPYPVDGQATGLAGSGEPTLGARQATEPAVDSAGRVSGDTCHLDVADKWGNLVSATPSGGWLQSSPTIPALGFCLGTRGQMFWLKDGLANSLRPGARPRTTLSPSLALRDGRPWLAFGTPGGDQQDQWSLTFLLSLIHRGHGLQQAVDAPMFHSTHFPSSFYPRESHPGTVRIEDRAGEQLIAELRERGHRVEPTGPWTLGRLSAVSRDRHFPGNGFLHAAANPRGAQGYAVGR